MTALETIWEQLRREFPGYQISLLPRMTQRFEAYWENADRSTRHAVTAGSLAELQVHLRKRAEESR